MCWEGGQGREANSRHAKQASWSAVGWVGGGITFTFRNKGFSTESAKLRFHRQASVKLRRLKSKILDENTLVAQGASKLHLVKF